MHSNAISTSMYVYVCMCITGERLVSERFAASIESADGSLQPILTQLYHLHLLSVIEGKLGQLMLLGG